MKNAAITGFMNEPINWGGYIYTRAEAARWCTANGDSQQAIDWLVYMRQPATPEQIATLPTKQDEENWGKTP